MNIINNSEVLGSLSKDLVLNTLGKIYVRVGDRYYELDFHKEIKDSIIQEYEESIEQSSDFLIVKSIDSIEFPGNNKFIISLDGRFYITQNGRFKNVTPKSGSKNNDSVSISLIEDANIIGQLYSDNLIIDFSSGEITAEELTVDKLKVKSLTAESLEAPYKDYFVSGSGKMYIGPEVKINNIEYDSGFILFYTETNINVDLFPLYEFVTDELESFIGEIVDVKYNYIKVRVINGEFKNSDKLILKGDYIQYDPKWKSLYNKSYNLRFEEVIDNGDYSDLEFITIGNNLDIILKSGTLVKCDVDCVIKVTVDSVLNEYSLKGGTLYLINKLNCIALNNQIYYFEKKSEFDDANLLNDDIAFIEETEQLYYKGLFIGNKDDRGLPDDFKIEGSQEGAIIVRKDNLWQPSYDYATHQYVTDKLNTLLNNAPEALDTLGEIASVLEENVNEIGDIIFSINEVSKKVDTEVAKLYEKINSQDLSSVVAILDTKATWKALYELEDKLQSYVRISSLKSAFDDFRIEMNQLISGVNNNISANRKLINNNFESIENLKLIDGEFATTIEKITGTTEYITESVELITGKVEKLTEKTGEIENTVSELDEYINGLGLYYYIQVIAEGCIEEYVNSNGSIGGGSEGSSITMTDVETYVSSQLSSYALKSWVSDNFAEKGSSGSGGTTDGTVDLSAYVTHTQLDSKGFVTQSQTDSWYLKKSGSNTYSGDLTIAKGNHSGSLIVTGKITHGSDIRYKDVLENVNISLYDIANAPLFNYKWIDDNNGRVHLGTSAQYWYDTSFCNAVISTNDDSKWTMDSGSIAIGNTIFIAKDVIKILERIDKLENENKQMKEILSKLQYGMRF